MGWPAEAKFQPLEYVQKFSGDARWEGFVVSAYHTTLGKLRYVIDVMPQGFQMIVNETQLRAAGAVPVEYVSRIGARP